MAALTHIQTGFVGGEIAPELWGRVDLAKYRQGASTMRNFFVSYRGPAMTRPGLAYVGTCKQPGSSAAPRDIPFQFSISQGVAVELGDNYARFKVAGAYVTETTKAITAATNANPVALTIAAHGYSPGDWIFITGMQGMTQLNGLTWIVGTTPDGNTVTLNSLFGNPVDSTAFGVYTSGGTAARIYTISTPYAAVDLPYLKYTQSADTMTLCCVNPVTGTEYAPYALVRNGAANWSLTAESFTAAITAPTGVTIAAQSSTTLSTFYSYVVTAVNAKGEESVASTAVTVHNNDIALNAGSNLIGWSPVAGAISYNVYAAPPAYGVGVPIGSVFGFLGTTQGTQFVDTNIVADFDVVPPTHQNPFARGQILGIIITAGGTNYTQGTVGFTLTTSTGTLFAGTPIVVNGAVVGFWIANNGQNFQPGDTITITDSATGAGATATLTVGPESGTYPSTVAYFQQRRAYASTLNQPDTYFMSKPGAFLNMDTSIPVVPDDAIVGTPWSQQVNGIQFMVPMPSGLIVLTGKGAWQLTGGQSAALTAIDQDATPQAYNGCSNHLPPITVNYDIIYVQAKGSIVRDLSYNFFVNIYTGNDITVLSSHLFQYYQLAQWAYAEEPFKIIWAARNDGIMLSLTYLKEQDIYAWSRHDTQGLIVGVCSITEPPVDAVYCIVQRFVQGNWRYYSERMDNRNWPDVSDAFCVDAGLSYVPSSPNATLTPSAANGTANITSCAVIFGGGGYSATPQIIATDPAGTGTGATFGVTVVAGVITAVTPLTGGQAYSVGNWNLTIVDPTGVGAIVKPIVTNIIAFSTSAAVFSPSNVGNVLRMGGGALSSAGLTGGILVTGGGEAVITSYVSATQVLANVIQPVTCVLPNDPNQTPIPLPSGTWSLGVPTGSVSGLNHLEGKQVAILADGSVMPPQTVTNGSVTLPAKYSRIVVGLGFTAQLQTLPIDPPSPDGQTAVTKRKNIYAVGLRVTNARAIYASGHQPDQSANPEGGVPSWSNLRLMKDRPPTTPAGTATAPTTGDLYENIDPDWDTMGQVAIQISDPLPATINAVVSYYQPGDTSG